jgi:hypothetical protein
MSFLDSLIKSFTGTQHTNYRQAPSKFWLEYEVDTYWSRHKIMRGASIDDVYRRFRRESPSCDLSCIGLYSGPKDEGDIPGPGDEPFMAGYGGNPGPIRYYNGAKPK